MSIFLPAAFERSPCRGLKSLSPKPSRPFHFIHLASPSSGSPNSSSRTTSSPPCRALSPYSLPQQPSRVHPANLTSATNLGWSQTTFSPFSLGKAVKGSSPLKVLKFFKALLSPFGEARACAPAKISFCPRNNPASASLSRQACFPRRCSRL